MNIAGGPVHGDDEWPIPPIAIPRGLREHAWHVAILTSLILLSAFPELRMPTLAILLGLMLVRGVFGILAAPWLLRRIAASMGGIAVLLAARWLEPGRARALAFDMFLRRADLNALELTERLALQAGLWATAALLIATFAGFDLRVVNREVADQRVWVRQQARRRQVMAEHHRRNPPPESV